MEPRASRIRRVWKVAATGGPSNAIPGARFLTTAIVFATVITGGVGYLLNNAAAKSAQAGNAAQRLIEEANGKLRIDYQTAQTDYFAYVLHHTQQDAATAAWWNSVQIPSDAARWISDSEQWATAADSQFQSVPKDLRPGSATAPEADTAFPAAFFAMRTSDAVLLQAQADGQTSAAAHWSKLTSSYTVVITLVTVALFLFGSSLALAGRNRLVFAVVGGCLLVVGASWAGIKALASPHESSSSAAVAYTKGVTALASATSASGFSEAVKDFSTAIDTVPDYAQAYSGRARAEFLVGSEALGNSITSQAQPESMAAAAADYQLAYALGLKDSNTVADYGFSLYSTWLVTGSGSPPATVVQLGTEALNLDPGNPISSFNLGLYQLASGDVNAAAGSYRRAMQALLSGRAKGQWGGVLAGAMTDLDNLESSPAATSHAGLLSAITAEQGFLTMSAGSGTLADPAPASPVPALSAAAVSASVTPHRVRFSFAAPPGWDPSAGGKRLDKEPLLMVWYERPLPTTGKGGGPWTAIAPLTVWSDPQAQSSPLVFTPGAGSSYGAEYQYANATGECLPPAQYRVDLYAGGHLLLKDDAVATTNLGLVPRNNTDLEFGMCAPSAWSHQGPTPVTLPDGKTLTETGIADSWVLQDAQQSEGALLYRIYLSRENVQPAIAAAAVQQVLTQLVTQQGNFPTDVRADTVPNFAAVSGPGAALTHNLQAAYFSPTRSLEVWAGGGLTSDHAIVVGVVWGPRSRFLSGSQQLADVFASVGPRCGFDVSACP